MAYGSYAVRYAPTHDKKKWVIEIHKTARAAMKAARTFAKPGGKVSDAVPVCVFDMAHWNRKPVCISERSWRGPGTLQTKHQRVRYTAAPHGIKVKGPGGVLRRLALDKQGNPIVKFDGYKRRKRRR